MANNTNVNTGDVVLIVENINQPLAKQASTPNGIVLEGVCAVFGEMNNNRRVYEKAEYLPHLTYLNEKISKGQLTGALDHPPYFEVDLKSASHIIERLSYDGGNQVMIKLRILENTPNGKIAKALLEGGVTLSTSSRSAGKVFEGGRVQLQKIFTYDLVGEPGFTQATLKQAVSESLQRNFEMITESYQTLEKQSFVHTNKLVNISESLNFADNFKVYKINKNDKELGLPVQETQNFEKNSNKMTNFVTTEQMDKYSEVLKTQFASIKKEVGSQKAILESITTTNTGEIDNVKLVGFVNYLAEQLEGVVNFTDYLSTKLNESIDYTQHVAETTNNSIAYSNYIGEKLNSSVAYQDYLGEKLNESINYTEYLKENVNNTIKYQNYLAEELDKGLQYTEYVAEGANKTLAYSEHLAENINMNRAYSEYVAERVGQNIGYTEYIAESLNGGDFDTTRNLLNNVSKLDESVGVNALLNKVDSVISEVRSKSSKQVLESKFPFLKVMSDDKKDTFYKLDSETKQAIVETLSGAIWFNEADVLNIMESVIAHKNEAVPNYIKFMPVEYKTLWSTMNESEKSKVYAKAQIYSINTPYQAKAFWDELDLRGINERIETQKMNNKIDKLNESQSTEGLIPVNQVVEMQRGYSQNYLETLLRQSQYRK